MKLDVSVSMITHIVFAFHHQRRTKNPHLHRTRNEKSLICAIRGHPEARQPQKWLNIQSCAQAVEE